HTHVHQNAALILVAPIARQFAMIGDRKLHERVGEAFWKAGIEAMRTRFVAGDIPGAVVAGLDHLSVAFHEHFAQ
ncbi:MAG: TPM domain-containing protein, partial [Vulcanimicrobiaceae bacterium]